MNRQVVTFNIGSLWYAEHTLPFLRNYATRIGADFCVVDQFPSQLCYGGSAYWSLIDAIKRFAVQDEYDEALFIDLDVIITPQCPNLFDVAAGRIGVVADMGIPEINDSIRGYCHRWFQEAPQEGPFFNSGLLVIPKIAARRLLSILTEPYPFEWPPDQIYLNLKITKREPICWLPREFNWLSSQYANVDEHHVIHFVGATKFEIPSFIEQNPLLLKSIQRDASGA